MKMSIKNEDQDADLYEAADEYRHEDEDAGEHEGR